MSAVPVTHLNFTGQARDALEFYAAAFGGQAVIRTYSDFGMPAGLPDSDRVVYGQVFAGSGFTVMAYDVPGTVTDAAAGSSTGGSTIGSIHGSTHGSTRGSTRRENGTTITDQAFFLALVGESLDEVTTYWDALLEGATVVEPLASSAWSAGFGMLTDRFGVTWAISVSTEQS